MACRGVLFVISDQDLSKLASAGNDDAILDVLQMDIEERGKRNGSIVPIRQTSCECAVAAPIVMSIAIKKAIFLRDMDFLGGPFESCQSAAAEWPRARVRSA